MNSTLISTKATAIAIILTLASATLLGFSVVNAQVDQGPHGDAPGGLTPPPGYTNWYEGGGMPLPAGVIPNVSLETIPFLSFRPNPVGLGQPFLVNLWMQPPLHVSRYFTDFTVTITKPGGTTDTIRVDSYRGDATAWFEYTADEVGTWKLKFEFIGAYFPPGNYSVAPGAFIGPQVVSFPESCYYEPSSTEEFDLVVQSAIVLSWPPSPLPTDYWTRPASPEHREWWPILGNYPPMGIVGGGPSWPAETNPYMSNYDFVPYVQGPKSAHIVWRRQGDIGGLIGGTMGQTSFTSGGGNPSIVYAGRCYQTVTKVVNGQPTSVWQCYDLRTGEVYWERMNVNPVPNMIFYGREATATVPGGAAYLGTLLIELMAISGGRIIRYDPWTGAVTFNFSMAPLTTGTYYSTYPLFLTVQNLGGNRGYRLINWTLDATHVATGYVYNYSLGVLNNVSWPFSSLGTVDYEAGIAVVTQGISPPATGVTMGQRIMAASLTTGQLLWNITTDLTKGYEGFFSGSTACADHGKFAVRLNDGHWHCWDLRTGNKLWVSEESTWPWGTFGAYAVQSAYGLLYYEQYDGVVAWDWDTGKIVWHYEHEAPYPYETPYQQYYAFRTNARIADGVLYTPNYEHTFSQPVTRGWKLHAINATSGESIWNITGVMTPGAIADGYLTASNEYDGYAYVFGKGKSSTSVSANPAVVSKGNMVLIQGTVLDQSPAQPGSPCISKESMATYMEFLHMQKPIPQGYTVTGVPLQLLAINEDGDVISIGETTSDVSGTFGMAWTPPEEGVYRITANFAGDDSYGSSWAETRVSVGPASDIPEPPEVSVPDYTMTIIGVGIAVIIAVVIAIAVAIIILRRR